MHMCNLQNDDVCTPLGLSGLKGRSLQNCILQMCEVAVFAFLAFFVRNRPRRAIRHLLHTNLWKTVSDIDINVYSLQTKKIASHSESRLGNQSWPLSTGTKIPRESDCYCYYYYL